MKKYIMTVTEDDNGKLSMECENHGFHGVEVLGFHSFKINDVMAQLCGDIKPDVIKRTVVKDSETEVIANEAKI